MKLLCLAMLALVPFLCEAKSRGVAVILGSASGITGTLYFDQDAYGGQRSVKVNGTINGLTVGEHGLHIYEYGDISNGCTSVGKPFQSNTNRTAGDLGKAVVTAEGGVATIDMESTAITLCGNNRVIGLSLVVTEHQVAGTAAANLIACGVIGKANVAP